MALLTPKQQAVSRFADANPNLTMRQIGRAIGRTRDAVRKLLRRARRAETNVRPSHRHRP